MKKFLTLFTVLFALATPSFAQVPERSRLIVPSSTSASWFRGATNTCAGIPTFSATGDTNSGLNLRGSDVVDICNNGLVGFSVSPTAATSSVPLIVAQMYGQASQAETSLLLGSVVTNRIDFGTSNTRQWSIDSSGDLLSAVDNNILGWSDVSFSRDAANVLAQRNGTNAQSFNLYRTFTDASNLERLGLIAGATYFRVVSENAGTGVSRQLEIGTDGTTSLLLRTNAVNKWEVNSVGHLLAVADNTYDIGASGATRPRTVYVGTSIFSPFHRATDVDSGFQIDGVGSLKGGGATGVLRLTNWADNGFTRLILGTNDASGIGISKNVGAFSFVNGNGSAFAATESLYQRYGSGSPEGVITAPIGAIYNRTDGGAGTTFYVKESGAGNTGWVGK